MNQTQATAGIGGSALTAAVTTALTGVGDIDAAHAAAYAFIILFVLGAAYSLVAWFVGWKWPSAPSLPNLSASEAARIAQAHATAAQAAAEAASAAAQSQHH